MYSTGFDRPCSREADQLAPAGLAHACAAMILAGYGHSYPMVGDVGMHSVSKEERDEVLATIVAMFPDASEALVEKAAATGDLDSLAEADI